MKQKRTRITNEIDQKIIECRSSGLTQKETAKKLHISKASVEKACARLDIHISPYSELTTEIENKVLEARLQGLRQNQIAKIVGISRSSVQKIFKNNGLKSIQVKHWKITPEIEQQVIKARAEGLSQQQIAKKIGIGKSSVLKIYQRLHIKGLPNGKINEVVWQHILELKEGGKTIPEISEIIMVNRANIQKQFNKRGIDISRPIYTTHKTCAACEEYKSVEEFGFRRKTLKNGDVVICYHTECKICRALHKSVSGSIRLAIKENGGNKARLSIFKYLPYTLSEFKRHIESLFETWMNWENCGLYNPITHEINPTWQIDHIIPHSMFKYASMNCQEFIDCWALSNLRPLDAKQNCTDGSNRTRHKKSE